MRCSMSRKANCWDNAPAESFFNSLKNERVHGTRYGNSDYVLQVPVWYVVVRDWSQWRTR
jgi:transposase InsO family protein